MNVTFITDIAIGLGVVYALLAWVWRLTPDFFDIDFPDDEDNNNA